MKHRLDDRVQRRGFLLDGFPRTEPQAAALLELLGDSTLDAVINLEVPAAVVRKRLMVRRVCTRCDTPTAARNREHTCIQACGGTAVRRPDDSPEGIERRLAAYEQEAGPLLAVFAESLGPRRGGQPAGQGGVRTGELRGLQPMLWGTGEAVG